MNRPWMPLYVADYRNDTAHLSAAEHGAYLLLIMHYWSTGGVPDDDRQLARIACMTTSEWKRARPVVQAFFIDNWSHGRIDAELARAADISSKRRASAEQRHSKRDASADANAQLLETHARTCAPASPSQSQSESKKEPSLRSGWSFDRFWEAYPHKVGKQAAVKTLEKIRKSDRVSFDNLMAGLARYVAKTDDRPWCNPATWLNEGRWEDQPALNFTTRNGHGTTGPSGFASTIDKLKTAIDIESRGDDRREESPRLLSQK